MPSHIHKPGNPNEPSQTYSLVVLKCQRRSGLTVYDDCAHLDETHGLSLLTEALAAVI